MKKQIVAALMATLMAVSPAAAFAEDTVYEGLPDEAYYFEDVQPESFAAEDVIDAAEMPQEEILAAESEPNEDSLTAGLSEEPEAAEESYIEAAEDTATEVTEEVETAEEIPEELPEADNVEAEETDGEVIEEASTVGEGETGYTGYVKGTDGLTFVRETVKKGDVRTPEIVIMSDTDEDPTITWYDMAGDKIAEGTTSITTDPITESGMYRAEIGDPEGDRLIIKFHYTVEEALTIYYESEHYTEGEDVELSVIAESTDDAPITYEWYFMFDRIHEWIPMTEVTGNIYVASPYTWHEFCCFVTQNGERKAANFKLIVPETLDVYSQNYSTVFLEPEAKGKLQVEASTSLDTDLTYRWMIPDGNRGEEVHHGTSIYELGTDAIPGYYTCNVCDGYNWEYVNFNVYRSKGTIVENQVMPLPEDEIVYTFTAKHTGTYQLDFQSDEDIWWCDTDFYDENNEQVESPYVSSSDGNTFEVQLKAGTYHIVLDGYDTTGFSIHGTQTHTWDTGKVTKAATCKEAGVKTFTCSECGEKKTESIPVDRNAHEWDNGVVTKEATAVSEGIKLYTCKHDKTHTKTEKIDRLPAAISINVKGTVPLKVGQTSKKVKVTGLTAGDAVKSVSAGKTRVVKASFKGNTIVLRGIKTGKATVTVTLKSGKSKSFKVKVQKSVVSTKRITGVKKNYRLKVRQTLKLSPVLSPVTAADSISYSSSNRSVATVSAQGKVTAKKAGTAVITIKAGAKTFKTKITVRK